VNIGEAIILGIVQGVTEFLPVSSSGHLVLLRNIFGIEEGALFFDTMVHMGTLVAVFAVLWQDIWNILRKIFQPLTLLLIIATIPTVITALMFRRQVEAAFVSANFLGFAFLITSGLLLFSESNRKKIMVSKEKPTQIEERIGYDKMTWKDALLIGLFQAVAIFPGISRSGATITGGLLRNLNREIAVRFAFLMSIPAILGALLLQLIELGSGGDPGGIGFVPIAVGTVIAAVTGFFSIKFMIKIVQKRSLLGFAIYTGLLGILVTIDQLATNFFF